MIVTVLAINVSIKTRKKKKRMEFPSEKRARITLQGCLDETNDVILCKKHGNKADMCYFCMTNTEPLEDKDEDNGSELKESKMFRITLNLDEQ